MKPRRVRPRELRRCRLPRLPGEAPLKQRVLDAAQRLGEVSSSPTRRGPIEACSWRPTRRRRTTSSSPTRRGPIEAPDVLVHAGGGLCLPRLPGEAPLKHPGGYSYRACATWSSSPTRRGPIEAIRRVPQADYQAPGLPRLPGEAPLKHIFASAGVNPPEGLPRLPGEAPLKHRCCLPRQHQLLRLPRLPGEAPLKLRHGQRLSSRHHVFLAYPARPH